MITGISGFVSVAKTNLQKNTRNKYYYKILGFSIGNATLGKPFGQVCFVQIFCTDFLHFFFARIFCTDFLHECFARIFCTVFCPIFLRGFLRGMLQGWFVLTFARNFLGVPKHLLGSVKISPRKFPGKFTMLWGPSGEGLGRQEGEVRL